MRLNLKKRGKTTSMSDEQFGEIMEQDTSDVVIQV